MGSLEIMFLVFFRIAYNTFPAWGAAIVVYGILKVTGGLDFLIERWENR